MSITHDLLRSSPTIWEVQFTSYSILWLAMLVLEYIMSSVEARRENQATGWTLPSGSINHNRPEPFQPDTSIK